jgi:gluconokinase
MISRAIGREGRVEAKSEDRARSETPVAGLVIVLMGVAGSGKTTIGRLLATELGWNFYEGDDFHSASNVEKMARGVALADVDRQPWLEALRKLIVEILVRAESAVIACSALKKSYRDLLLVDGRVKLVYLKGDIGLLRERLRRRSGHFMPAALLPSQFEALEEPENAIYADASLSPNAIVMSIRAQLKLKSA